jgi:hypothetical protein
VNDLAAARDRGDCPDEIARVDAALDHLGDALQALGGDAHFFRLARGTGSTDREDQGDEQEDAGGCSHRCLLRVPDYPQIAPCRQFGIRMRLRGRS